MREAKSMPFAGIIGDLEESFRNTDSEGFQARLTTFMVAGECPECHGTRLNARSGAVRVAHDENRGSRGEGGTRPLAAAPRSVDPRPSAPDSHGLTFQHSM